MKTELKEKLFNNEKFIWYKVNNDVNTDIHVTPAYKDWVLIDVLLDGYTLNDKNFTKHYHKATFKELFEKKIKGLKIWK